MKRVPEYRNNSQEEKRYQEIQMESEKKNLEEKKGLRKDIEQKDDQKTGRVWDRRLWRIMRASGKIQSAGPLSER